MEISLTPKQERFCQEYVVDLNATQAAIRAGYSEESARVQASKLLTKLNIQERVRELQTKTTYKLNITRERIMAELQSIAFANPADYCEFNESGVSLKDSRELSREVLASIQEVSEVMNQHGGSRKVKQHDKLKALELIAKMGGFHHEKVEHTGTVRLADVVPMLDEDDDE